MRICNTFKLLRSKGLKSIKKCVIIITIIHWCQARGDFPLAFRNEGEEIIMNYNISLIPGDGIGPEIVAEAKKVLDKVCEKYGHTFSYSEVLLGGASIDVHGVPLTDEAIATAKASDAVLMGSIGGDAKTSPWYKLEPSKRPEAGLLAIRKLSLIHI